MKNHVKQMCRRPLQLLLMIVLVMIVTVMLVVGGNLWVTSDRISKAYEDDFITAGRRLQAISNIGEVYHDTQPVLGINSTDLLLPFYEGSAWVYEGRYPTKEEYAQGSPVCLAPREFAENNGLSVGDQVMTHLYYTCSGDMAAIDYTIAGGGGYYLVLGLDGEAVRLYQSGRYFDPPAAGDGSRNGGGDKD